MKTIVPEIPGALVTDEIQLNFLKEHVQHLCVNRTNRFPGAQPVSFNKQSLDVMLKKDFWVCEKSDGLRVLLLIVVPPATNIQEVYLIDRKNQYYRINHLYFPHFNPASIKAKSSSGQLNHTLLDGELVVDQISETQRKIRLLLFDSLVLDEENIMQRPLSRRYGCLQCQIYPAFSRYMKSHPNAQMMAPFEVLVKPMDLAYGLAEVLKVKMPKLRHGCDGLIFTSLHAPYEAGTTINILKWKPPQENTIDFKIHLNFPPDLEADPSGKTPDWKSKPRFQLLQHVHGDEHEFYDWLDMDDEEWDEWKKKSEQLDDRIVECSWHPPSPEDKNVPTWHITRVRDDKTTANHKTTVSKIMESIRDGVMEEELISLVPEIRAAWKSGKRESYRARIHKNQQPRPFPPNVKGLGGPGPPMKKGGMPNLKRR